MMIGKGGHDSLSADLPLEQSLCGVNPVNPGFSVHRAMSVYFACLVVLPFVC